MVITGEFPVISYLFWVCGKYHQPNNNSNKNYYYFFVTGKEKARHILHVPDNDRMSVEHSIEKGTKGRAWQEDTIVGSSP